MKLIELQKIVNEAIEMWNWDNIVCIVDEDYTTPERAIQCTVPVLTLDNLHHGFDWNSWMTFLSFEDKWDTETSA